MRWFRWRFRRNGLGNLNSGKENMETLELEFIHQEQTPKKRVTHFEEIRIRFIVCLSFIKLIDDKQWILHTTYSSLKGLRIDISQTRGRSSWTISRIGKNEWINMIIKEKESWTNHRKNSKMTDEKEWITGKNCEMNEDAW